MDRLRNNPPEVVGLRIPDEDILGWRKFLEEEGFDPEFIESFLLNLNEFYLKKAAQRIDEEHPGVYEEFSKAMEELIAVQEQGLGRKINIDEKKKLLEDILADFNE